MTTDEGFVVRFATAVVLAIGLGALWLPWGLAAYLLLGGPITARATLAAVVVLPSAWVMAEAVRSLPSLGGPWALLGASQWNQPATLASASLGGVWLTSFVIAAANIDHVFAVARNRTSGPASDTANPSRRPGGSPQ